MHHRSTQQELAAAIRLQFPDAVVKKIDEDNYLDIHLPSVHPRRGAHLFFNTMRGGIRIGYHCRDDSFVTRAIEESERLERFANGVRPLGNPVFPEFESALRAARDFLAILPCHSHSADDAHSEIRSPTLDASDHSDDASASPGARLLTAATADAFLADPESIDLSRFTEISLEASHRLGTADALLFLDGLTAISDEALHHVCQSTGGLSLDGLTTLTAPAARILGSYRGPHLWLQGIGALTDEARDALRVYGGTLHTNQTLDAMASPVPASDETSVIETVDVAAPDDEADTGSPAALVAVLETYRQMREPIPPASAEPKVNHTLAEPAQLPEISPPTKPSDIEALARGRFESATETYRLDGVAILLQGALHRANIAAVAGGCVAKTIPIGPGIPQVGPVTLSTLRESGISTNADIYTHSGRLARLYGIGPERAANIRMWAERFTDPHDRLSVELWHLRQRLIHEKRQRQQTIGCLLLFAGGIIAIVAMFS